MFVFRKAEDKGTIGGVANCTRPLCLVSAGRYPTDELDPSEYINTFEGRFQHNRIPNKPDGYLQLHSTSTKWRRNWLQNGPSNRHGWGFNAVKFHSVLIRHFAISNYSSSHKQLCWVFFLFFYPLMIQFIRWKNECNKFFRLLALVSPLFWARVLCAYLRL